MIYDDDKRSPLVGLRESVGLTQEALAAALGVTDHTVRNWEKGRTEARLTIKQMKILCELLHLELKDLPDSFNPLREGGDSE
jgi:DNA-binding XRE family transcriptional regulator